MFIFCILILLKHLIRRKIICLLRNQNNSEETAQHENSIVKKSRAWNRKVVFVLKFVYTDKSLSTKTLKNQPGSNTGCFITNESGLPNSIDPSVFNPNSMLRTTMPLTPIGTQDKRADN